MKTPIKAAVFDIDGTLTARGQSGLSPAVRRALDALRAAGVTLIVATGRAPFAARDALGGFWPDYLVCATGAVIQDRAGRTVRASRMTAEEMYALVDYCEDDELPLDFVFDDGYYVYVEYERMARLAVPSVQKFLIDGEDQTRHLEDMPYAACVCAPDGRFDGFFEKYGHLGLRALPFAERSSFYDVVHRTDDKADSIGYLLEKLGASWRETAAFGDGVNDERMLACAGLAVVMEDAEPQLKQPGRVIAPPAAQDGVAWAIEHCIL